MLSPFFQREEVEVEELDALVEKMKETNKNPGLKEMCTSDNMIKEFGLSLMEKLGMNSEQRRKDHDNIRTKLRAVGRLLKKLNENKFRKQDIDYYLCPSEFKNVVHAVKELSQEANSPNLALTLGHYVKQLALLKGSKGIETGNEKKQKEAKDFQELYAAHWKNRVSSVANRRKRLRCLNKNEDIPSTEDLILLKDYTCKKIKSTLEIKTPSYEDYVGMCQLLIVRISLFNKRRISEVDELKVEDFDKRLNGYNVGTNDEIIKSLDISERTLLKR